LSLKSELSENWLTLIALCEEDLGRREDALNGHNRSSMTVRGFAITAVAALVAASYVSSSDVPAFVGAGVALYFAYIDLQYSLLYAKTEQSLNVLHELSRTHRKLLSRRGGKQRQEQLANFRGDMRSYAAEPAVPKEPRIWARLRNWLRDVEVAKRIGTWLKGEHQVAKMRTKLRAARKWRPRSEGLRSYLQFVPVYFLLAGLALFSGFTVTSHQETIVLCRPSGEIGASTAGIDANGCELAAQSPPVSNGSTTAPENPGANRPSPP
jgi:hypothetical protein